MKDYLIGILFCFILFIAAGIEILILQYVNPHLVAKNKETPKYYSIMDNPKNFKFECFWDFSTSLFPSRICTYEPIKKD